MATNETFRAANCLSVAVPSGRKSGDPIRLGGATGLNGVLETDRAKVDVAPYNSDGSVNTSYNYGGGNPTGNASVWLAGAHEFTVAFAVASEFTPIYIVIADNTLTDTSNSGANPLYGHALTTKGAPSGPLTVRIAN